MTFVESIQTCFSKYAVFNGKAKRSEYWWWALFILLASLILGFFSEGASVIFQLATLVPYIAVTARRLHDVDKSGWWQLLWIIPVIGWIIMIVWLASESKPTTRFD